MNKVVNTDQLILTSVLIYRLISSFRNSISGFSNKASLKKMNIHFTVFSRLFSSELPRNSSAFLVHRSTKDFDNQVQNSFVSLAMKFLFWESSTCFYFIYFTGK